MSELIPPIAYQLGIGVFGGFLVGYVLKKVIKIAIVLAVFVFALIFFAYGGLINVNYDKLIDSISNYSGPAWEFLMPLLSNLPFIGSFILGFVIGLKAG